MPHDMRSARLAFSARLIIVLSLSLSGCGAPPEEVSEHRVGEKVSVENLSLTVSAVRRNIQGEATLGKDRETISLQMVVVNEGKFPVSFKLEELMLQDAEGRFYKGRPQGGPGSLLATGRYLAMNDRITGILIFEISKWAKDPVLVYKPARLKNKVYRIRLT